jgi:hypothetical protein
MRGIELPVLAEEAKQSPIALVRDNRAVSDSAHVFLWKDWHRLLRSIPSLARQGLVGDKLASSPRFCEQAPKLLIGNALRAVDRSGQITLASRIPSQVDPCPPYDFARRPKAPLHVIQPTFDGRSLTKS